MIPQDTSRLGDASDAALRIELEALRFRIGSLDRLILHNAELQVELAQTHMQLARSGVTTAPLGSFNNPTVVKAIPPALAGARKPIAVSSSVGASVLIVVPPKIGNHRVPAWETARLASLMPSDARILIALPSGTKVNLKLVGRGSSGCIQVIEAPHFEGNQDQDVSAWTVWISQIIRSHAPSFVTHLGPAIHIVDFRDAIAELRVGLIVRLHHDDFQGDMLAPELRPLVAVAKSLLVTSVRQKAMLESHGPSEMIQVLPPAITLPPTELSFLASDTPARVLYMHDVDDSKPLAEFIALARRFHGRADVMFVLVADEAADLPANVILRPFPIRSEMLGFLEEVEICFLPASRNDLPQWLVDSMALGRIPVMTDLPDGAGSGEEQFDALALLLDDQATWPDQGAGVMQRARSKFLRSHWQKVLSTALQ